MANREKIKQFLFHLGRGIWKAVPVLGPIVDEVVYAQFEEELAGRINTLPDEQLRQISDALPTVDPLLMDQYLDRMSDETRRIIVFQIARVLTDFQQSHEEVVARISDLKRDLQPLPSMLAILTELRDKSEDQRALLATIDDYERRRRAWISRISKNQRRLLESLSDEYTSLTELWALTLRLIPDCGYKEFRFRLHELEWLGLVERYRDQATEVWRYRRTKAGSEALYAQ